jgi:AraC-like DNA-binding protein
MRYHGRYPDFGLRFFHQFDEVPLPEFSSLDHVGEMVCDRARTLPEHRHPGFEICYVAKGHLLRTSSDGKYTIRPGEFFISRPGEGHGGGTDPAHPCHYYSMGFDSRKVRLESVFAHGEGPLEERTGSRVAQLPDLETLLDMRVVPGGQGAEGIFRRMLSELESLHQEDVVSRSLAAAMVQVQVLEILLLLMKCRHVALAHAPTALALPRRPAFRELMQWLATRLSTPPSLSEMAARCGLSTAHFCTAFKRDLGMSPMHALVHLRLGEAARRLAAGDHSIHHVASMLGFESPQYFAYAFRKQFGCTPSQYRRRHHAA